MYAHACLFNNVLKKLILWNRTHHMPITCQSHANHMFTVQLQMDKTLLCAQAIKVSDHPANTCPQTKYCREQMPHAYHMTISQLTCSQITCLSHD